MLVENCNKNLDILSIKSGIKSVMLKMQLYAGIIEFKIHKCMGQCYACFIPSIEYSIV